MWLGISLSVLTSVGVSLFLIRWIMSYLRESRGVPRPLRRAVVSIVSYSEMAVGLFLLFLALFFIVGDVLSPVGQGIAFGVGLLFLAPALLLTASGVLLYKPKPKESLMLHLCTFLPLLLILSLQGLAVLKYKDIWNTLIFVFFVLLAGILVWGCKLSISLGRSK